MNRPEPITCFFFFVQVDILMTLSGQPINGDKKAPAPQERSGDVNACEKSGERFQLYQPIPKAPCVEYLPTFYHTFCGKM